MVVGVLVGWALWSWAVRRREHNAQTLLNDLVGAHGKTEAEAASRAWSLVEQTKQDPSAGSAELATLHWDRKVRAITPKLVRQHAEQQSKLFNVAAASVMVAVVATLLFGPFRVVEGLDVLFATNRQAPVALEFVDSVSVHVHPPEYLRQKDREHRGFGAFEANYGSEITVRAAPLRSGREMILTDGKTRLPMVDDGAGALVATWPLKGSTKLRIVAQFGQVDIDQNENFSITSIADETPRVLLETAPRSVKLLEEPEVPIVYKADDDHGLTEVDLVLRVGAKEQRRLLSKLEQEVTHDQGGTMLRASDPFLREVFLPVEVTVEARDNDPLTGPKWGRSESIILVPPAVGEEEALRAKLFAAIRDRWVDLLAEHLKNNAAAATRGKEIAQQEAEKFGSQMTLTTAENTSPALPRKTEVFLKTHIKRVNDALTKAAKSPSQQNRDGVKKTLEDAVLAIDSSWHRLVTKDAQKVAKRLSAVALELADGLQVARGVTEAANKEPSSFAIDPTTTAPSKQDATFMANAGIRRADTAFGLLGPGGKALRQLGSLGDDLGEIVKNDLGRIDRTRKANDLKHAELAARDLAARLARPNPSFMGGGSSHGGGAESGGGQPDPGEEPSDDSEKSMDQGKEALDELSQEHKSNLDAVEEALRQAMSSEEVEAIKQDLKKHADAIRDSVKNLPRNGDPSTAEGAASAAREKAQQMGDALERGNLGEAIEAGKEALNRLEKAQQSKDPFSEATRRAAKQAADRLSPEVKWTEDAQKAMQQALKNKLDLDRSAEREKGLAEKTKDLLNRGKQGQLTPEEVAKHLEQAESRMKDAAKAMKSGDVNKALEGQREAQKLLDDARHSTENGDEKSADNQHNEGKDHGGKNIDTGPAPIPKADEHKGPEEFRKRVLDGLSQPTNPRLRDAIQRYSEKLLR